MKVKAKAKVRLNGVYEPVSVHIDKLRVSVETPHIHEVLTLSMARTKGKSTANPGGQ